MNEKKVRKLELGSHGATQTVVVGMARKREIVGQDFPLCEALHNMLKGHAGKCPVSGSQN